MLNVIKFLSRKLVRANQRLHVQREVFMKKLIHLLLLIISIEIMNNSLVAAEDKIKNWMENYRNGQTSSSSDSKNRPQSVNTNIERHEIVSYDAFGEESGLFNEIGESNLIVISPHYGDSTSIRLTGVNLQRCLEVAGADKARHEKADEGEFGCFPLAKFKFSETLQGYLVRIPLSDEMNRKVLFVYRGNQLLAYLVVAGNFGEQERRAVIEDLDGDGDLDVATLVTNTADEVSSPATLKATRYRWQIESFTSEDFSYDRPTIKILFRGVRIAG